MKGGRPMKELRVYYCSKCGRYSYHHIPKNAVCPECSVSMPALNISYQTFMDLDYPRRDQLIADQITEQVIPKSSVIQKITGSTIRASSRVSTAKLCAAVEELEEQVLELRHKNEELEATTKWMHDLIWDLEKRLHEKPNAS